MLAVAEDDKIRMCPGPSTLCIASEVRGLLRKGLREVAELGGSDEYNERSRFCRSGGCSLGVERKVRCCPKDATLFTLLLIPHTASEVR